MSQKHQVPCWELIPLGPARGTALSWPVCPSRCVLWFQIPQHNHEEFSAINVLFLTEEAEAEETLSWGHTVIGGPAEFDLGSLTPDLEKRRAFAGSSAWRTRYHASESRLCPTLAKWPWASYLTLSFPNLLNGKNKRWSVWGSGHTEVLKNELLGLPWWSSG